MGIHTIFAVPSKVRRMAPSAANKPRFSIYPAVALLAGLVLVAAVCVLVTSGRTENQLSSGGQMLLSTQMLAKKGSEADQMRDAIFKELETAMQSIRTQLVKKEADSDKALAEKFQKHIEDEKKKVSKFFEAPAKR